MCAGCWLINPKLTNMALTLKKVLISDEVDPRCVDILTNNGIQVVKNTKLSKEELLKEIPQYDGLIVRSATKVTADIINAATKLKIIGRAGTGVDNIDCNAATKNGVVVMNTPGGNTLSAAEHTCTLLLALSRHVSNGTESLRKGRWDRKKFLGNEVYGKTLGIIGLGRIGKEVALRMQSFGMQTIGYDPIIPAEESATFNVQWMLLEEMWPKCDYITVHTPLIPQTKNLLNDDVFMKCKKGVRVINCARGGIIDEEALLRAFSNGQCRGAGLDVFTQEPPTNLTLLEHPMVTSTPHLGANTVEAQSRVAEEIAQQFVDVVEGRSLFGAINAQALTDALSPDTRPWVQLGTALGRLGANLVGPVTAKTQVEVKTQGESLKKAGSYLSAAVMVGLLGSQSSNGLNLVSAPAHAKEMGLQVKQEHTFKVPEGYRELVTVVVQQPGGATYRLNGHVGGGFPLLVSVDDASFCQGVLLQGNLIVYRGKADPSVLSSVIASLSAKTAVQSFATTGTLNGETWSVMQIRQPVEDLEILKPYVNFVVQTSL